MATDRKAKSKHMRLAGLMGERKGRQKVQDRLDKEHLKARTAIKLNRQSEVTTA